MQSRGREGTSERLKAVEVKGVSLKEINACAAQGGRELLRDGMHGMPKTCQPQAVVGIETPRRSIVLQGTQGLLARK